MVAKAVTSLGLLLDGIHSGTPIRSRIDQWLYDKERKKSAYIPRGYHPSSLDVATCSRFLVYQRLGFLAEPPIDPGLNFIFDNGTAVGNRIQSYLINAGILQADQVEMPMHGCDSPEKRKRYSPATLKLIDAAGKRCAPYEFRGHLDGFAPNEPEGATVIEIKGMNERTHNSLHAPIPKHVTQASLYAFAYAAKRIVFLYECKNNQAWKEFVIKPDMTRVKAVQGIVLVARRGLANAFLPPRHKECASAHSEKAKKCYFASTCFGTKKFKELDQRSGIDPRDYR